MARRVDTAAATPPVAAQTVFPERTPLLTAQMANRRNEPCIYALCDREGAAFYVGKTKNLGRRVRQHLALRLGHTANVMVAARIRELGENLRISIIQNDPSDPCASERAAIAARPWLLNLIGPHHWSWSLHQSKPWAWGTGKAFPSKTALQGLSRPRDREAVRKRLAQMSVAERCVFETRLYQTHPVFFANRCHGWLEAVADKMIATFSELAV